MKRWISIAGGVLLSALMAATVVGAPRREGGPLGYEARETTITFDATTADSPTIPVGGSCIATFRLGSGGGAVSLYSVPTSQTAAASGTLLTTFTATTATQYRFQPGHGWLKAVAASDSNGSVLTVNCSYVDLAEGSLIDRSGDGLFEYIRFPQDFDGDGTGWKTCDCGGTTTPGYTAGYICGTYRTSLTDDAAVDYSGDPDGAGPLTADSPNNPAVCRFHGERVWDDTTDDAAAMEALYGPGTLVEWEPGTYDLVGTEQGDTTDCWDSATETFVDDCPTDDDGSTRFSAVRVMADSLHFKGAGGDANGETDLIRSGTWVVQDNGRKADHPTPGIATLPRVFCMGHRYTGNNFSDGGCGGTLAPSTTNLADVLTRVNVRECVDADQNNVCDQGGGTPDNDTDLGALHILCVDGASGGVADVKGTVGRETIITIQTTNGYNTRYWARVAARGATCGSGSAGLTLTFGGSQLLTDIGDTEPHPHPTLDSLIGEDNATGLGSQVEFIEDSTDVFSNQLLEGFTFAHHNYVGDGNCTTGAQAACDEGAAGGGGVTGGAVLDDPGQGGQPPAGDWNQDDDSLNWGDPSQTDPNVNQQIPPQPNQDDAWLQTQIPEGLRDEFGGVSNVGALADAYRNQQQQAQTMQGLIDKLTRVQEARANGTLNPQGQPGMPGQPGQPGSVTWTRKVVYSASMPA